MNFFAIAIYNRLLLNLNLKTQEWCHTSLDETANSYADCIKVRIQISYDNIGMRK